MQRIWWWIYDRYWLAVLWLHDARTPKAAKLYIKHLEEANMLLSEQLALCEEANCA